MTAKKTPVSAINLILSSHHDLGWHKGCYEAEAKVTFDELNKALDLMKEDPGYAWSHECCGFLYGYLQAFPERADELRQRAAEHRLDLGAGYAMPYTSFVPAELLVRQMIYGKKWAEDTFPGCRCDCYYNTDIPGLGTQMPQVLQKSGVNYLYASRSWSFEDCRLNEYRQLEAPDGSRVKTFFMHHYGDTVISDDLGVIHGLRLDQFPFLEARIADYEEDMKKRGAGSEMPLLLSQDCFLPADYRDRLDRWNAYAEANGLPQMQYSTICHALDRALDGADLSRSVHRGEWPSKWFYENGASDEKTFGQQREAEQNLRSAEALAVLRALATGSFDAYPAAALEKAWRAAAHSCHGYAPEGSIRDFRRIYREARDQARAIYDECLNWLVEAVSTDPAGGLPVVVYNGLGQQRDDLALLELPADLEGPFRVVDARGTEVPCQQTADGKLLLAAEAVPALGYKVYYIRTGEKPACHGELFPVGAPWEKPFSSRFYAVTPTAEGGAVEQILDLDHRGRSLFTNEKFRIGELFDFRYDGMGAGEQLNMWQPHDGESQLAAFGPWHCIESGPVRTVFETRAAHTARGPAAIRLSICETIRRLDWEVELDLDQEPAHQLRLMFPVNSAPMFGSDDLVDQSRVRVTYEVPFGAVTVGDEMLPKFSSFNRNDTDPNAVGNSHSDPRDFHDNNAIRPREVQNWIEAADPAENVSLQISSRGLGWDYQDATPAPCRTPVLQPVLMCSAKSCHGTYGHWLQPGPHTFRFSLTSGGACTRGRTRCMAFNHPLEARFQQRPGTILPAHSEGIRINRDHVILTACKKAEDDDSVILRWYEAEGRGDASDVTITLPMGAICAAERVNLIERPQEEMLRTEGASVTAPLSPWSIETCKFLLQHNELTAEKKP